MPYPDEGIIDTGQYPTIEGYLANHHNLKKKLKEYRKVGGRIEIVV
jgi:hypothetical protein